MLPLNGGAVMVCYLKSGLFPSVPDAWHVTAEYEHLAVGVSCSHYLLV